MRRAVYTRYWAIEQCCAYFGLDQRDISRVAGDGGTASLLDLWETIGLAFYEHPDQILRQECWHASRQWYEHPGFWLALPQDGLLLDYGCGTAELARLPWIFRGGRATCVDCSKMLGGYLATKYMAFPGVQFLQNDVFAWEPDSVDGLICTDVLEHVEEPLHLQQQLWKVLKPGGHALLRFETLYPHPGHLASAIAQFPDWVHWLKSEADIIEVESYAWVKKRQ